jgi:hypothetical protein
MQAVGGNMIMENFAYFEIYMEPSIDDAVYLYHG